MKLISCVLLLLTLGLLNPAWSQTNPTAQSLPYSQDFSGTAHTSTTYPAGWQGWTISTSPGATFNSAAPTADRALVASSTASTTAGNVHNYNGKIGFLNNASLDLTLVLALNTTGLTNIQLGFDIMTIRNPYDGASNTRINEVGLQYRIGTSGTFTDITGTEYQNNTTGQTGAVTSPQNSQTKSITLPTACNNQSVVQIRWPQRQVSGAGSRPSFALDNITVTGTAIIQYRSLISGNWNSTSTWEQSTNGGASWTSAATTPTSTSDSIRIMSGDTVTVTAAVSVDQVIVDAGGVLINTVNALTISDGTGTDLTVDGTLMTSNGIANSGQVQMNGTFELDNGGFITGSPSYGSSSTLLYNINSTYGRSDEWTNTSGPGYPHNVTLSNNTILNYPNGSTAARSIGGNLTVNSGSALYMDYGAPGTNNPLTVNGDLVLQGSLSLGDVAGGDLVLKGNWSNSGGTFTANNRAVTFSGTGAQSISNAGGESFVYLIIDKSSGTMTMNNPVTITGSSGSVLQLLNSVNLDLNGNDLTLENDGGAILAGGGARVLSGATVNVNGTKTVTSSGGGTLTIANAYLNDGVNFGAGLTTISTNLRLNAGGYVDTNPPYYDVNSVLTYYSGGTYGRSAEWSNTLANPGSPYHVVLNNSTQLDLGANGGSATARSVRGNLFIIIGSELTMNASGNEMTASLYVDGDVSNDGTLTLSSLSGGNIHITGNYTQNSTYTPNGRAMIFEGAGTSTITGAGMVLDDLEADKAVALSLGSNITVNGTLNITGGSVNTGTDTLFLGPSGSLSEPGNGSIVHGNVQASRTISSTGANETFGNLGYEIEAVSLPVPGATTITRVTDVALSGEGNFSIKRSYDVSAATNTGVNLNIKFHYDDTATELNGSDESKLLLFRSPTGAAPWGEVGYTTRNTAGNYVTLNNVHRLSTWTAADSLNILGQPVLEGSDVVAVPSSESATISSLENDSPVSTTSDGAQVWQIRVRDGGIAAPDADGFPTELVALVLNQGASNQVSDWSQAIQEASLFDGSTFITNGTINPTSISFSGFSVNVPDNDSLTLSLRISLNNPLGTAVADNQHVEFALSDADVTAGSVVTSSQFGTFPGITSDETQNAIDVIATQLAFTTQPQNNQITGGNIAPVSVAATDANGNTDTDYGTGMTLSSGTFTLNSTDVGGLTHTPSSGVASWTNLSSSTMGTGTLLANSGSLTQGTSNSITIYPATVTSIANGSWSAGGTWDQGSAPLAVQSVIVGHSVTLAGSSTAAHVTVNSGGILDAGAFVLTVPGAFTLDNGAEFRQGGSVQDVPGATRSFATGSTYRFNGTQAGMGNFSYPQFGTLIWEPAPSGPGVFQNSNSASPFLNGIVANVMTINLQGGSPQEVYFASGTSGSRTHTISTLNITSANSVVVLSNGGIGSGATAHMILTSINVSAGTLQGLSSSAGNTSTSFLTVKDFFTVSGTGLCALGSGTGFYTLRLTPPTFVSGPHQFIPGAGNTFGNVWVSGSWELTGADLTIAPGYTFIDSAYFDCNSRIIAGGGNFGMANDAYLVVRSAAGITNAGPAGDVQVTGTRSFHPQGNYSYSGSAAQQTGTGLPSTVRRLLISNSNGVTLSSSTLVTMTLQLDNNVLHTLGNTVEIVQTGSVSTLGSGRVHGNLKKYLTAGPSSQNWEIGDATSYTPVLISGTSFSSTFGLTVSTYTPDHPFLGSSNIDVNKSVNRFYSVLGPYNGPYNATFTFVPGDLDAGANTSNFIVGRYYAGGWTNPTVGAKTSTTTQVTGITSIGEFAIGEQEIPSFTIDATAFPNGSINPSGSIVVNNGNDQQFTFTPNTGYHVDSVFVDGAYVDSTVSYTFYNVSASHTIAVAFAINTYTITVTQGANGVITPGTTIVTHGGSQAFTVTPNTGYHLDSMMVDGLKVDSTTSYTFVNVTANHSITALFSINTYTLNVAIVGSGTVDKAPDQLTYTHGSNVQLTPDEAFGWNFSGWSGDAGGNTNPLNVLMDGNKNINATFVEDPVYQAEYRSFSPESLAVDKDNKGKIGKYVKRKTDKVDFKFVMVAPGTNIPLKLKFSMSTSGVMTKGTAKTDTLASWTNLKEVTTTVNVNTGDTIQIDGRGVKGKQVKTTYDWSTLPTHTKGTVAAYMYNWPRFPMPNRVNVLFETLEQGGFSATSGLLVGKDRSLDSAKQYGWLLSSKYGDVLKSLYISKTATQHTGKARGFDVFVNGKPVVKRQKSILPSKHNNKLLAEMIALKLNIAASALSKTPNGFGELEYYDPSSMTNIYNIQLTVTDNSSVSGSLYFGVDPAASFCEDPLLGEQNGPPAPPETAFDIRWINPRPVSFCGDLCFDCGRVSGFNPGIDIRQFVSSSQIDTYKVRMQPSSGGYPMTITWPSGLNAYATSMQMVETNGTPIANMLTSTSAVIGTGRSDFGVAQFLIISTPQSYPGSQYSGKTISEIAAIGDSLMMGYYQGPTHTFADSSTFAGLYAVVDTVNDAFEGVMDTTDFAVKLHVKGSKKLIDVPYLRQSGVIPAKIIPVDVPLAETPVEYSLAQNYPNPFNPTTTISFDLPLPSIVTLKVYNMLGQEVGTLLDKEELEEGMQEVTFDAQSLASGVYFYRIVADGIADEDEGTSGMTFTGVKKMLLVK